MPGKQVFKTLSPEEATLLANLKAIIQELESLQDNDNQVPEAPAEMSLSNKDLMTAIKKLAEENNLGDSAEDGMPDDKKDKATKSKVTKEDNGPTANDDAEDRIDNQTDINDNNKSEVGKTLLQLLQKGTAKRPVAKSNDADIIANVVKKALEPIVEDIQQVKTFNSNMLDALGFADKVEKSLKENSQQQSVQKGLTNSQGIPVQSVDSTAVVGELVNVIKSLTAEKQEQSQFRNDWNGMQKVRKNLQEALPGIFSQNLNKQK